MLLLILIGLLLPILSVPEVQASTSTVYEQNTSPIMRYPNQKKTLFGASRYWAFPQNTTAPTTIYYRSSADGTVWNDLTALTANSVDSWFATWFDEENDYLHYTATFGDLKYRRGTLQPDGSIVWADAEYTLPAPWVNDWWYLRDTNASIAGTIYDAVNGTYGTTNSTTEVVVGTASIGDLFYIDPFENTTSSFGTSEPGAITRKGWRTSQFTKTYTHGGWTPNIRLITRYTNTFKGRIGIRIWNDTNADLSTATILKNWTWLNEKTYATSGEEITTNQEIYLPSLTMTNEYMYFEFIFNVTQAGTNADAGFFLRANDIYARVRANRMKQWAPISAFNIAVDSAGYPHIIAVNMNGFNNTVMLAKAQFNNGSWGSTTWTELKEDDDVSHNYNCALLPLASAKLLAIYQTGYWNINSRFYNGASWGSQINVTNTYHDYPFYKEAWSTSSDGSTAHIVFNNMTVTGNLLRYSNWTEGSGWASPIPLGGDTAGDKTPSISLSQNGTLYAFWANSSTIMYKRFNSAWDSTVTAFDTDSSIQSALTFQTSYLDYGNRITVSWIRFYGGAYHVRFNSLAIAPYRFTFYGPYDETTGLSIWENVTYEKFIAEQTISYSCFGTRWYGQGFVPDTSHVVSYVSLRLSRLGSPGIVEVSVRNTTGNLPTGSDLALSSRDGDVFTTGPNGLWYSFAFNQSVNLLSGTRYAIVVRATSGDSTNLISVKGASGSDATYTSGLASSSDDSGSSWNALTFGGTSIDFNFREAGLENGVEVTAYFTDGTDSETFVVRGTYVFAGRPDSHKPQYFKFGTSNEREYWLSEDESTGDIYIFDDTLTSYTIAFLDLSGALDDYSFVLAQHYVNGTLRTVEKRKVDEENKVEMYLVNGRKYVLVVQDGATYTFGDVLFTSILYVQLTLKGLAFPLTTQLIYNDVLVYWEREFGNPSGNITLSYQDLLALTTQVEILINYRNGTNAYNATETSDSFVHIWASANNATDYQVIANINHASYGLFDDRNFLPGALGASAPFGLGFIGSLPFDTSVIIPSFLILFVAGCFSMVNVPLGAFLTVVLAGAFVFIGLIAISSGFLITALAFAIMLGVVYAKRKMQT